MERSLWILGGVKLFRNSPLRGSVVGKYSRTLRKTITRCLAFFPDERFTCVELLGFIRQPRAVFDHNSNLGPDQMPLDIDDPLDPGGQAYRGQSISGCPDGGHSYWGNYLLGATGGFRGNPSLNLDLAQTNPWRAGAPTRDERQGSEYNFRFFECSPNLYSIRCRRIYL